MAHTYASVAELKDALRDSGSSDLGQGNDALYLSKLESASRAVDGYAQRSMFGSGFGPRTGTNHYAGSGGSCLRLQDDLLSVTTLLVRTSVGDAGTAAVITTDFYLDDPSPYRDITLHGQGNVTVFGTGYRVTSVTGSWGYQDVRSTAQATVVSGLASDATVTVFVLSASPDVSPGETLRIESEHLYVSALDGTIATVTRGANGTTAATHANGSAISIYRYPSQVVDATIAVATRRLRVRDAGLAGGYGGQDQQTAPLDSENAIIRAALGRDLRLPEAW